LPRWIRHVQMNGILRPEAARFLRRLPQRRDQFRYSYYVEIVARFERCLAMNPKTMCPKTMCCAYCHVHRIKNIRGAMGSSS
jgi:hypothetical protein